MDETPVWTDMVSNTTVDKCGKCDIPLKSTGHEKVCVSVCLAAKKVTENLKPLLLYFPAPKNSNINV